MADAAKRIAGPDCTQARREEIARRYMRRPLQRHRRDDKPDHSRLPIGAFDTSKADRAAIAQIARDIS